MAFDLATAVPVRSEPEKAGFDLSTAVPVNAPEKSTAKSVAISAASGLNRGVAGIAGLPVDTALNIADLARAGYGTVATALGHPELAPEIPDRANVLGSSANIAKGLSKVTSVEPASDSAVDRYAFAAGAGAPAALSPGNSLSAGLRGIAGSVAGQATADAGGGAGAQAVANLLAGGAPEIVRMGAKAVVRGGEEGRARVADNLAAFDRVGASPSVGQATGSRAIQGVESALSKFPGGAGVMADRAAAQQTAVGAGADRIANDLSPKASAEKTGAKIVSGVQDDFLPKVKQRQAQLYADLDAKVNPKADVPVASTRATLQQIVDGIPNAPAVSGTSLIKNSMAGELLNALDADAPGGKLPYEALKVIRTRIGQKLEDFELAPDVPRQQLRKIYSGLTDDMRQAAQLAGPDALEAFKRANFYTSAMHKRIDLLQRVVDKAGGPEKVFQAATAGTGEGATTLRAVMKSLPSDGKGALGASIIRRLGRATPGQQNDVGDAFSTNTFLTNWSKLSPEAKTVIAGPHGPEFRKDLDALAKVASNLRDGSKVFANPSGTAGSTALIGMVSGTAGALGGGHYRTAAGIAASAGGANIAARVLNSPAIVRSLANATELPPEIIRSQLGNIGRETAASIPGQGDSDASQVPGTPSSDNAQGAPSAPLTPPEPSWASIVPRATEGFARNTYGAGGAIVQAAGELPSPVLSEDPAKAARPGGGGLLGDGSSLPVRVSDGGGGLAGAAGGSATGGGVPVPTYDTGDRVPVAPGLAVAGRDVAVSQRQAVQGLRAGIPDGSAKGLAFDVATNAPQIVIPAAVGLINPPAGVALGSALAGGTSFGNRYDELRNERGLSAEDARQGAAVAGATELLTEKLALGQILKIGGRAGLRNALKRVAVAAGAEGAQEAVAQAVEEGYNAGVLGDDVALGDALSRVGYAGLVGAIIGGGARGGIEGVDAARSPDAGGPTLPQADPSFDTAASRVTAQDGLPAESGGAVPGAEADTRKTSASASQEARRQFLDENGMAEGADGSIATKTGSLQGHQLVKQHAFLDQFDVVAAELESQGAPITASAIREELRRRQRVLDLQGDLATAQTPEAKAIVQKHIDAASAGRTAPAGDLEALAKAAEGRGDKDVAKAYREAIKEIPDGGVADQGGESGSGDVESGLGTPAGAGSSDPNAGGIAPLPAGIAPAGAAPVAVGSGAGEQAAGVASDQEPISVLDPTQQDSGLPDSAAGLPDSSTASQPNPAPVEIAADAGAPTSQPEPADPKYDLSHNLPKNTRVGDADAITGLASAAAATKTLQKDSVRYAVVDPVAAGKLKEATGLDVEGYRHSIDNFAVRHALREHGDERAEAKRGQQAIKPEDFAKIPDIVQNYDEVQHAGKDSAGNELIRYRKRYNGSTYYVEEVRNKRGELAAKTLWKTRTANDAAKPPAALNAQDDSRNLPQTAESVAPNEPVEKALPVRVARGTKPGNSSSFTQAGSENQTDASLTLEASNAGTVAPNGPVEQDAAPKAGQEGSDTAARRGPAEASHADVKQAQRIVDSIASTWANKPTIKVIASMQDQVAPEAARLMDLEQKAGGAMGEVGGFIYQNEVYINAAASADPRQIVRTLYHEALGHFGLRGVFGPQMAEELKRVAFLRAKDVKAKLVEYGLEDSPKNRLMAAEEVLARLAETDPQLGLVQRVLAVLRRAMRPIAVKLGIEIDLSDAELIRDYLEPARDFVQRGAIKPT